jgi:cystathionine gamma-synthase
MLDEPLDADSRIGRFDLSPSPVRTRTIARMHNRTLHPSTILVSGGRGVRRPGDPFAVPVTFTSVYRAGGAVTYGREGNPTWGALEEVLGLLEGGSALVFSSGVAAISAVMEELPPGATVVAPRNGYSGMRALLADAERRGRLAPRLVDVTDTAATLDACEGAALLWIESPTNPLLGIADLATLISGARARGALAAVDNTLATPLTQRPFEHGADLVVHSITKYLAGHSDVLLGAVIAREPDWQQRLSHRRTTTGAIPGPMDAFLALRGLRTLELRMERAQRNAGELARRLADHPAVNRVRYPGLPGDPGHERATRQMRGYGAMVSMELVGGPAAADAVCEEVRLLVPATSFGGLETSLERRNRLAGEEDVPASLVRISVGCEHIDDLWQDLDAALSAVSATDRPPKEGDG